MLFVGEGRGSLAVRSLLMFVALAVSMLSSQGVARPTRQAQLILMLHPVPAPQALSSTPPPMSASASAPQTTFRVHDLSRRFVEFQMRAELGNMTAEADAQHLREPRQQQVEVGVTAPSVSPMSAIPVPAWMRDLSASLAGGARFSPGCLPELYRPTGFLRLDAEARRQAYYNMMSSIACEYGVPVGLFDALIIRESRYDSAAISPKKAFGLTQLMPGTAAGLGVDRYDPEQNLRGGASYLRQQLDRFGHYHLALAAYNAGPSRVRGVVPAIQETQAYVDDILRNWSRLSGFQRTVAVRTGATRVSAEGRAYGRSATLVSF